MSKTSTILKTIYVKRDFPNPKTFIAIYNDGGSFFNPAFFIERKAEGTQIEDVIIRAKQDYGEAFKKLAAED